MRAELPRLAKQLRALLEATSRDEHARWFLGSADDPTEPPARAGYVLDALIAERLARRHALEELARLPLEAVRPEIVELLHELEGG